MIDALTTSCSPSRSAKNAISSSGRLPNVTLSSPPIPGPARSASSSVAVPMIAAVGTTPSADVKKISVGLACASSSPTASGMNGTSRYGQPFAAEQERDEPAAAAAGGGGPGPSATRTSSTSSIEPRQPPSISTTMSDTSVGVRPTRTPAASSASALAFAVPAVPETIAPAWPIVLPGGAVKPAM